MNGWDSTSVATIALVSCTRLLNPEPRENGDQGDVQGPMKHIPSKAQVTRAEKNNKTEGHGWPRSRFDDKANKKSDDGRTLVRSETFFFFRDWLIPDQRTPKTSKFQNSHAPRGTAPIPIAKTGSASSLRKSTG